MKILITIMTVLLIASPCMAGQLIDVKSRLLDDALWARTQIEQGKLPASFNMLLYLTLRMDMYKEINRDQEEAERRQAMEERYEQAERRHEEAMQKMQHLENELWWAEWERKRHAY